MPIDPSKPLLRLQVGAEQQKNPGRPNRNPGPPKFSSDFQNKKFGPKFEKLRTVLERDDGTMILKSDPAELAPERLIVFEVRGSVQNFAKAVAKIPGLILIDENELPEDQDDEQPYLYLILPDYQAMRQLVSLWTRWSKGETLGRGFAPWKNVFSLLRDLRPWGPKDRLRPFDKQILQETVDFPNENGLITLEVELVFIPNEDRSSISEQKIREYIKKTGGNVLSSCRISDISYHALLIDITVVEIKKIIQLSSESLIGYDEVMFISPQSIASSISLNEEDDIDRQDAIPSGRPILALIDGFPIAQHPILANRLEINDLFSLESVSVVSERSHGTAMASLITRGDLNNQEQALKRKILVTPVLGKGDGFPSNRLIIDLIYEAIRNIFEGENPAAPNVLIINLSLGNVLRPFDGRMSAWARLIDRLSYEYGILFIVSAGNHGGDLTISGIQHYDAYQQASHPVRATKTLEAIKNLVPYRQILSPAESINALTIGASNIDNVSNTDRLHARTKVDPYSEIIISNPSSALGPGYAQSIKPDLLFPGGKEHLIMKSSGGSEVVVSISGPARAHGLKVAAPPKSFENQTGYSGCTSGATALASRTCHQIHDALEEFYGQQFLDLPKSQRAALLKALLVHTCSWPEETSSFIKGIMGPADNKLHAHQKDNIRRFIGYGLANPELAISCVSDRATFWAVGQLGKEKAAEIEIPIPQCISAKAIPHYIQATLAWITPVAPGRKAYKSIRFTLNEPDDLPSLGIEGHGIQPDKNQSKRGTVFSQNWKGSKAAVVGHNHVQKFWIQREPDQLETEDENVPFALAITLAMPSVNELYEQVSARLNIAPRLTA